MNNILLLASALACVDIIDLSLINLVLPTINNCNNCHINNILWVLNTYLLCSSIATLILPFVTKFFLLYKILLFSSILYLSGAVTIYFLHDNLEVVLIARVFQGIGVGFFNPSSLIIINNNFQNNQFIRASSIYGLIILGMSSIIPLIYDAIWHFYHWKNMLLINILLIFVILKLLSDTDTGNKQNICNKLNLLISGNHKLYQDKNFITYLLISCVYFGISTSIVTFSSFFFQMDMGLIVNKVSLLMFFRGVGACISFISIPCISIKYKPNLLLSFSLIITIFAYFMLYQTSFWHLHILSFFLQGFALGIFNVISVKCALHYVPQNLNILACSIYIFSKCIANLIFIELFKKVVS